MTAHITDLHINGSIFLLNHKWVPDNSKEYSITGSFVTSLGSLQKKAEFGSIDYIYSGWNQSASGKLAWVACLTKGDLILPIEYFEHGPSDRFVDNYFEAVSFGKNWVLISLDPKKQHRFSLEIHEGINFSFTQSYPGTIIKTAKGYVTHRIDGWYFSKLKNDKH